ATRLIAEHSLSTDKSLPFAACRDSRFGRSATNVVENSMNRTSPYLLRRYVIPINVDATSQAVIIPAVGNPGNLGRHG
ncbi:MAG: hypothetical protein M3552_19575, partial [Planctomycetota bacterium]|nr:hypothetical protein [Planctomycetota bacterium]